MSEVHENGGYDSDSDDGGRELELEPWVRIQANTFTNWINDKLRVLDLEVTDPGRDFRDGVKLCRLMEVLKGKGLGGRVVTKKKLNHYEAAGNLALALQAMSADGVRLVNIGAEDIAAGNTKLVLGMIWTLIRRYQIGSQSRLPPKKLMLSWINAVLHPHMNVTNFSSDWNDGIALHGVIDYCRPGSCPDWYTMSRSDRLANCHNAMSLAEDLLEIPIVVSPEHFASPDLDELSGMTYLSYFMAEGAPGYKATLDWTRSHVNVENFDRDWNNGYVLSGLVNALGGSIPGWPNIDSSDWQQTLTTAMQESERHLGVEPVITARDMMNPEVDHIGVMAYAAWHQQKDKYSNNNNNMQPEPVVPPSPSPSPSPPPLEPEVIIPPPPSEPPPASEEAAQVKVDIVPNWKLGATSTITVDTQNEGTGDVRGIAHSPTGTMSELTSTRLDQHTHHLSFSPSSPGTWTVNVYYEERETKGSPFNIGVYDPSLASINRPIQAARVSEEYNFEVSCKNVGLNDLSVYVVRSGETVPHQVEPLGDDTFKVTFTPEEVGSYSVTVFCGGIPVPGSSFDILTETKTKVRFGAVETIGVSAAAAVTDVGDEEEEEEEVTPSVGLVAGSQEVAIMEYSLQEVIAPDQVAFQAVVTQDQVETEDTKDYEDLDELKKEEVKELEKEREEEISTLSSSAPGETWQQGGLQGTSGVIYQEAWSNSSISDHTTVPGNEETASPPIVPYTSTLPLSVEPPAGDVTPPATSTETWHHTSQEESRWTADLTPPPEVPPISPYSLSHSHTAAPPENKNAALWEDEDDGGAVVTVTTRGPHTSEVGSRDVQRGSTIHGPTLQHDSYQHISAPQLHRSEGQQLRQLQHGHQLQQSQQPQVYGPVLTHDDALPVVFKQPALRLSPYQTSLQRGPMEDLYSLPLKAAPHHAPSPRSSQQEPLYALPNKPKKYNLSQSTRDTYADGYATVPSPGSRNTSTAAKDKVYILSAVKSSTIPRAWPSVPIQHQQHGDQWGRNVHAVVAPGSYVTAPLGHSLSIRPPILPGSAPSAWGSAHLPAGVPFEVQARSPVGVRAEGAGLVDGVQGKETHFDLYLGSLSQSDVSCTITGPDGEMVPVRTESAANSRLQIFYTPQLAGEHTINVLCEGLVVAGSPYTIQVQAPNVYVRDLDSIAFLHENCSFTIDASEMSQGQLEIDSDLPVRQYDKVGVNTYRVTFVPRKLGKHDMVIKYNSVVVEGSPFEVYVKDPTE